MTAEQLESKIAKLAAMVGTDKSLDELKAESDLLELEIVQRQVDTERATQILHALEKVTAATGASLKDRRSIEGESGSLQQFIKLFSYLSHIKLQSFNPTSGKLVLEFLSTSTRKCTSVELKLKAYKPKADSYIIVKVMSKHPRMNEELKHNNLIRDLIGDSDLSKLCHHIQCIVDSM